MQNICLRLCVHIICVYKRALNTHTAYVCTCVLMLITENMCISVRITHAHYMRAYLCVWHTRINAMCAYNICAHIRIKCMGILHTFTHTYTLCALYARIYTHTLR